MSVLKQLGITPEMIAAHTVKVEDPLPPSLVKNKSRLLNLERGLTIHGARRKGTVYARRKK